MSLIGKNVGNYRVLKKIGEGGMGTVYLGEHPILRRQIAIKTLRPEYAANESIVSRFLVEAKSVNDIRHPNIVDIVDLGRARDAESGLEFVYFVMEFLDGEPLTKRLQTGVTPVEAVAILRQCCSALAASHKHEIVHRDLKPDNIFLVHSAGASLPGHGEVPQVVKLLDFGVAKLLGDQKDKVLHSTRAGTVIGTPAYMSPEQGLGKDTIDQRSDIYSLGVIFYEMLAGRLPFRATSFGEFVMAHASEIPPSPSMVREGIPEELEAIAMHAIEKAPERRFQTAREFLEALDQPAAHLARYGKPRPPKASIATQNAVTLPPVMPAKPAPVTAAPAASAIPVSAPAPIAARPPTAPSPLVGPGSVGPGSVGPGSIGPAFADSSDVPMLSHPTTLSSGSGQIDRRSILRQGSGTGRIAAVALVVVAGLGAVVWKYQTPPITASSGVANTPIAPTTLAATAVPAPPANAAPAVPAQPSNPTASAATATPPVAAAPSAAAPAAIPPVAAPPAAADVVHVTFDSVPPGAKVVNLADDSPLGETPFVYDAKRGPELKVAFIKSGYKAQVRSLTLTADADVRVAFTAAPAPVHKPIKLRKSVGGEEPDPAQ